MTPQELNQRAEMIISLASKGMNPQAVFQQMVGGNGSMPTQQINQTMTQLNNMAEGRSLPEFYLQALKQHGLTEQNAQGLAKLLGVK